MKPHNKLLFVLTLLVSLSCLGCENPGPWMQPGPAPQPAPPQPAPVDALQCLTTDVARIAVARPSGSTANRQVAAYIETELKKLGLVVQRQAFSSGTNIIGIQKGTSSRTIIIGGHYDSVSRSPGADDNASGTAMTLLMARQLSRMKLQHTIRYVFFDAEERGLVGSAYYAKNMRETCDFMLNFDMVGCLRAPSIGPDAVFSDLFKKYPWAKAITFRNSGPSDHASFRKRGIPCAWIFTGDHSRYHKSTDTARTLNYQGMVRINRYAKDLILGLDKHAGRAKGRALIGTLSIRPYTP